MIVSLSENILKSKYGKNEYWTIDNFISNNNWVINNPNVSNDIVMPTVKDVFLII